jgi:hypothetical protein
MRHALTAFTLGPCVLQARAEAVAAAVNASLGKADSRAAAVLEERVLEPLQDSIMRIKQAYRQEDAPGVWARLASCQQPPVDGGRAEHACGPEHDRQR